VEKIEIFSHLAQDTSPNEKFTQTQELFKAVGFSSLEKNWTLVVVMMLVNLWKAPQLGSPSKLS